MEKVLFEKEGHIAVVKLNRPDVRNAICPEMIVRLCEIWDEIKHNKHIRVAIVTSSEDGIFCSGADLGRYITLLNGRPAEDQWDQKILDDESVAKRAFLRDMDVGKPVIAAINGHAIAGGMEIVHGTDLRVASETALFGLQEAKWGIFPAGASTVRLPEQIPYVKAMEMLLTGELYSALELHQCGFFNYCVPEKEVFTKAWCLAEKIARNAPIAVQAIRRSVRSSRGLSLQEALDQEFEIAMPVFRTKDAQEGPRSFLEKRNPVYIGE
ncbi:enoyl-CoA hydratase-related protein [Pseudoteredinibacter isoporae]|uniref:Enoyl-CoA hydratase n=1 Tax=Pseudoteredinibacter isoporae TaxID=570281 RepID=A0A7X0JSS6_9GAMM|nr:enoyl-CoA hydratase-related protein [Pseudoteredinibacter isoporae]MBB6521482.1 enoyl-CoA hydratase [Pseudoteredinibacter isoporae]NHO87036.1 crotonase/enoyl-CoA hydratase family protein [Pseudoteredinibacter isoporae]NIB24511.1 crotonase/enoyl-CoA hydratase family protein [Pseudoteredinibacter isoporae]